MEHKCVHDSCKNNGFLKNHKSIKDIILVNSTETQKFNTCKATKVPETFFMDGLASNIGTILFPSVIIDVKHFVLASCTIIVCLKPVTDIFSHGIFSQLMQFK